MADYMKDVGNDGAELSVEERNLLSVAYKNTVGSRRAAWRIISSVEQKEKSKGNEMQAACAKEYRVKVEDELQGICDTILKLLNNGLIPKAHFFFVCLFLIPNGLIPVLFSSFFRSFFESGCPFQSSFQPSVQR